MYKIMVVDDESLTREYMKKNIPLIDSRWQVVSEAMDGQEALDLLKTNMVDLIITDIKMPVMDGLQLSKKIYESHAAIKIVILSGYEEFGFAKEAIKFGVIDYLLKPLVKEDLCDLLNRLAEDIEKAKHAELDHKLLLNKSEKSSKLAVKNYLKAVVSGSSVEIKTLSPMLSNSHSAFINLKGTLLMLHINEYSSLDNSLKINEMPLYKFILTETCENIAANYENTIVFLDKNENVIIFINLDSNENYKTKCMDIFTNISKEFTDKTGLTLSGGIAEPESHMSLLKSSYKKASYAMECALLYEDDYLAAYEETIIKYKNQLKNVKNIIYSIVSGILNNDERQWTISLIKYIDNIYRSNTKVILNHCIFLINSLKNTLTGINEDEVTNALINLGVLCTYTNNTLTKEILFNMLKNILQQLAVNDININELNSNEIVHKAKQYIYTHYSEPISLEQIADKISVSYSYLSSIFHKSEGESYIKFLTRVRMEEAAKLIKTNSKIKIYDVAENVGYVNVKHFSSTFKNYFNVTPGEYLENYYKKAGSS